MIGRGTAARQLMPAVISLSLTHPLMPLALNDCFADCSRTTHPVFLATDINDTPPLAHCRRGLINTPSTVKCHAWTGTGAKKIRDQSSLGVDRPDPGRNWTCSNCNNHHPAEWLAVLVVWWWGVLSLRRHVYTQMLGHRE